MRQLKEMCWRLVNASKKESAEIETRTNRSWATFHMIEIRKQLGELLSAYVARGATGIVGITMLTSMTKRDVAVMMTKLQALYSMNIDIMHELQATGYHEKRSGSPYSQQIRESHERTVNAMKQLTFRHHGSFDANSIHGTPRTYLGATNEHGVHHPNR